MMNNKTFPTTCLVVILSTVLLVSQCTDDNDHNESAITFETIFGSDSSDSGHDVQQTIDGGYIICGTTYTSEHYEADLVDIYLLKTDHLGQKEWSKSFDGGEMDNADSIIQTSDGGFVICGSTSSSGNIDILLLKTDGSGNETWSRTFDKSVYDVGCSTQQTVDGGYIICGIADYIEDPKTYIIKTDKLGNETWSRTFDASESYSIQQTSDGGFIICGLTYVTGKATIYLIKTDESGHETWSTMYGDNYDASYGNTVQQTNDGGYIIIGTLICDDNTDIFMIKTNNQGNEEWTRTFGINELDIVWDGQQTSNNDYIICGYTDLEDNDSHNYDVYLIKTDNQGNEVWYSTREYNGMDVGASVRQTSDGGFIICGFTHPFDSHNRDVFLIKTDENGNV